MKTSTILLGILVTAMVGCGGEGTGEDIGEGSDQVIYGYEYPPCHYIDADGDGYNQCDDCDDNNAAKAVYCCADADNDKICDKFDECPGTTFPDGAATEGLNPNHWILGPDNKNFITNSPPGGGPNNSYTIFDTKGCSCEQIIAEQGLGQGHMKHGCSISAMDDWVALVNP